MMVIPLNNEEPGKVREIYVTVASRVVLDGKWSSWTRFGSFTSVDKARDAILVEAGRDTSFGGLMASSGPRQFRISQCVETVIECWDTSAKAGCSDQAARTLEGKSKMTTQEKDRNPFIAVNLTPAMSGYFATLYTWSQGEGGVDINGKEFKPYWFPEPWTSGIGRYATWQEANVEGEEWAKIEGVKFIPATAERVAEAEASAERFRELAARVKELNATGMDRKAAWDQAKAEQAAQDEEDRQIKLEDAATDVDFWPGE